MSDALKIQLRAKISFDLFGKAYRAGEPLTTDSKEVARQLMQQGYCLPGDNFGSPITINGVTKK